MSKTNVPFSVTVNPVRGIRHFKHTRKQISHILLSLHGNFEGVNCLLKHLYNRDTANVFHGLFVHCFQCGHILAHKLCIISTHHLFQKDDADPHRYQTANSQPPVKEENQNNNRNRHDGCTGQIRELMGQEPFCKSCIIINDFRSCPLAFWLK